MCSEVVRQLIRRKLGDGRLPRRPVDVWLVPRGGQICTACEESIGSREHTVWGIAARNTLPFLFHEDCFQCWESERSVAS
jgi:hypothetical protein